MTSTSAGPRNRTLRAVAIWLSLLTWLIVAACAVGQTVDRQMVAVPTADWAERLEAEREPTWREGGE